MVDVHRTRIRQPFGLIEPSFLIGVFGDRLDVFAQGRVAPQEGSLNNRIKIGDGLETFEPANDLPMMQLFMRADVKSLIHHVTKHARGEFGHADPPVIGSDFLRPGMGRTVAKRDR